jgi:TonB family protein
LLVSLLVNAVLVRFVGVGIVLRPPTTPRSVEMTRLSPEAWAANRAIASSTPADRKLQAPAAAVPTPAPPPPPDARGQVVDIAPSKDSKPSKNSRFLAEHDSSVEKETISRNRRPGFASTQPTPTQPSPGAKAQEQAAAAAAAARGGKAAAGVADGRAQRNERGTAQQQRPTEPRPHDRLALRLDKFGELAAPNPEKLPEPTLPPSQARGEPGGQGEPGSTAAPGTRGGPLDPSRLKPSASTYDRLAGGPAPDHVTDVEEGEGTFLNAREWKYASYFNRIKQAVASTWDPNRALGQRDPDGKRFAYRDRYTVVSVKLDDAGSLKDVGVVKSSGVDFLDEVAMDAFRKAQPFVNPPRGLADGHGEITFNFGFYLEVNGGFRMFRARQ